MSDKTRGQIGFEAYGEAAGWKTFDGRPMPTWDELDALPHGAETKRRWEVAAEAILDGYTVDLGPTSDRSCG